MTLAESFSERRRGSGNPMWERKHTEESKMKMSFALKGKKKKAFSKKHKLALSQSLKGNKRHLGIKHTEETKKQMSESRKGKNHPMYGKHHSKKTKEKIAQANKGRHSSGEFKSGTEHPFWKGGRNISPKGYAYVYQPNHPNADPKGYMAESRLIVEKALGRYLKSNEIVHHLDGDESNNKNQNLLICSKSYHSWLHWNMSKLYMKEHFQMEV